MCSATAGAEPRLVMRGITKRFGTTQALRGVDLEVRAGEVLGLVGENGAGKSTLMKVLSGAHQPDAGQMQLDGEPYAPASPLHSRRAGVAMIYQELSLAPHLSIQENIVLGVEPRLGPLVRWGEVRRIAHEAMARVGLGELSPAMSVRRLSAAQQQLVEIARAVAGDSRMIVLDEPTSSLSAREIEGLFGLIDSLKRRGLAIVYISHFLEEISAVCDRYTVLRDGMSVGGGVVAEASHERIISLMVGRDVKELYPRSARCPGEVIVRIDKIGGRAKPASASLELHRGEVVGIAGLMGAGRTELLRAIFGLDAVKRGEITIGTYTGAASPARRWRQGVGFVSENRTSEGLAVRLSIADNITLPRLDGLGIGRLVLPWRRQRASRGWIERLSIRSSSPAQAVSSLSGGNQQKVAIARLLYADVDVLLLDEPTRGIDVGSKAQIYRLIDELARGVPSRRSAVPPARSDLRQGLAAADRPRAVLIVSSYLPELLGICDRIAVMCRGQLGEARPVNEWTEHRLMAAAIGEHAMIGVQ